MRTFVLLLIIFFANLVSAKPFRSITPACEEALALSALPVHLRERANVYVFKEGEFQHTIKSEGGFHCLVERNHPDAIVPQCVTPSGEESILPGLMFRTKQTWLGDTPKVVLEKFTAAAKKGDLVPPKEPGINYMMSAFNHIYVEAQEKFSDVPAHIMFFAPNISNEDIGGSQKLAMQNTGFPFVGQSGIHGYMISMVEKAADGSDVLQACKGQL